MQDPGQREGVGERELALDVTTLRELIRNLQAWQALFEAEGIDTITGPDGTDYHLVDIEYIYSQRMLLSARQRQAIELCLFANVKEKDASRIMGVSVTNPVAMYATNGLRRLCDLIASGQLDRYAEAPRPVVA